MYCPECGNRIERENIQPVSRKHSSKKIIIGTAVGIVVLTGGVFASMRSYQSHQEDRNTDVKRTVQTQERETITEEQAGVKKESDKVEVRLPYKITGTMGDFTQTLVFCTYDDRGLLSSFDFDVMYNAFVYEENIRSYRSYDENSCESEFSYDNDIGAIHQSEYYDSGSTSMSFDEETGKVTSLYEDGDEEFFDYTFDDNGYITSWQCVDNTGYLVDYCYISYSDEAIMAQGRSVNVTLPLQDGLITSVPVNHASLWWDGSMDVQYNENGMPLVISHKDDSGIEDSGLKLSYDARNRVIESKFYQKDICSEDTIKYEYNENGEMMAFERLTYDEEGNRMSVNNIFNRGYTGSSSQYADNPERYEIEYKTFYIDKEDWEYYEQNYYDVFSIMVSDEILYEGLIGMINNGNFQSVLQRTAGLVPEYQAGFMGARDTVNNTVLKALPYDK